MLLGIVNIPSCYTLLYSKASVIWDFLFTFLRFLGYNCLAVVEDFTPSFHNSLTNSHLHLSSCSFFKIGLMTPIVQTTQMLIILMLTLIFNKYKQLVDEWTSRQVACKERQSNKVSRQVNQLLTIKKKLVLILCLPLQATCSLV